jgi:2-C-methyl-D-erythritol 2,4-cyclodiphosphate synthase
MLRIGQGYDVHRLATGRPLWLGCVRIPFERGAVGHSDGDAAAHALCDALLGAAGLGDMGLFFPSSDVRWKDAASEVFLRDVGERLRIDGCTILSADVTVVIEKPRLAPHLEEMRRTMARALGVAESSLSVKAKSADGLGDVGAGEAVMAMAVALVEAPPRP